MTTIIERIINDKNISLNPNELDIIRQLNNKLDMIPSISINQLSKELFTSVSTLHRTIKKLGFSGYTDFKYQVSDYLNHEQPVIYVAENYLENVINEITLTHKINKNEISNVAKSILNAKNKFCYGTGWKQKQLVDNFSNDLLYYGESFTTLRTIDDLVIAVNHMDSNSLLLIVSVHGNPSEYLHALKQAQLKNVTLVTITIDKMNNLSKYADFPLFYKDDSILTNEGPWTALSLSYLLTELIQEIGYLKLS